MRFKILKQGGYGSGGISETGGNMSGPLVLASDPSHPLQAATKGYVDTALGALNAVSLVTGLIPVERLPAFTGDITNVAGSNAFSLSESGVTPGTYPKVTVTAKGRITNGYLLAENDLPSVDWNKVTTGKPTTMAGYGITDAVSPAGGTMTGDLVANNQPTSALHLANKAYIDGIVAGNASGSFKTGDIVRKVTATTPSGFLRCNGGEVSQVTYNALFEVLKHTYATKLTLDYTSYLTMGSGMPWQYQHDFKTTSATELVWTAGTALPLALVNLLPVVTKNRVYLIGNQVNTNVYSAPINPDGTLGAWGTAGTLPVQLNRSATFVTKNRVYLVGGNDATASTDNLKVYSAVINVDGTLGVWTNVGNNIPAAAPNAMPILTKNRVYIFTPAGGTFLTAPINTDGTLGAWTTFADATFEAAVGAGQRSIFATKNRIYIIKSNKLHTALVNADGTLGSWTEVVGGWPNSELDGNMVVTKNRVWMIGGLAGGVGRSNKVFHAPINADGTVGTWTIATNTLAANIHLAACFVVKDRVYFAGGTTGSPVSTVYSASLTGDIGLNDYTRFYNGTVNKFDGSDLSGEIVVHNEYPEAFATQPGNGQPWQQHYAINTTQSEDLGNWGSNGSIPDALADVCAFVTKNRVYVVGGNSTSYSNTVYTATINADTGAISGWTTAGTFPVAIGYARAFVTKNRVYTVGGFNGNSINTVYSAPINEDGTIGAWTGTAGGPSGLSQTVFTTKNRVYSIGTSGGIKSAVINADGTIGAWETETSFPVAISHGHHIVTKSRVYYIGGSVNSARVATVYSAPINTDGTLGAWVNTNKPIPTPTTSGHCYVTSSRAWLFGGFNGSEVTGAVFTAPIDKDGVLGTWTSASVIAALSNAAVIVVKNRLCTIGGTTANSTNYIATVRYVAITGGLSDYSAYYNGTITFSEAGTFRLPDYSAKEMPGSYTYIKA